MRSKNPELMNKICKYAEQYYLQNGHSPSTSNIANAIGISRATAYRYLLAISTLPFGRLLCGHRACPSHTLNRYKKY